MSFQLHHVGDILVAQVEPNRMHGDMVEDFRRALMGVADLQPRLILLDLSAVEYVDSTALSALVAFQSAFGDGVHLCGIHTTVQEVMRLTRLDDLFPIHSTREAALKAMQAPEH